MFSEALQIFEATDAKDTICNCLYEKLTKKNFNVQSFEIISRAKVAWLSKRATSLRPQLKGIEEHLSKKQKTKKI